MKGKLIGGGILKVWGKDAQQYLNSRLTCDIVLGKLTPCFALTPRGMVEGFFRVAQVEDYFIVHFDNTLGFSANLEILFRYKVSEKLDWEGLQNHVVLHVFEDLELGLGLQATRTKIEGFDHILSMDSVPLTLEPIEEFDLLRVKAGFPLFFEEVPAGIFSLALTNQELIPVKSVCYVGQEAVEKARSLGRPPYYVLPFEVSHVLSDTDLKALQGKNFNLAAGLEAQILSLNKNYGWAKLKKLPISGFPYDTDFGRILFYLEI